MNPAILEFLEGASPGELKKLLDYWTDAYQCLAPTDALYLENLEKMAIGSQLLFKKLTEDAPALTETSCATTTR